MHCFKTLIVAAINLAIMVASAEATPVSYTPAQANKGETAYKNSCLPCHQPTGGGGVIPNLINESFKTRWAGRPVAGLFQAIKRMPPGTRLEHDQYANITAYLLKIHGIKAGKIALPTDLPTLNTMQLPVADNAVATHTVPAKKNQPLLSALTPVTSELLSNSPANDWLSWGRNNENTGFSPLNNIDKKTIGRLSKAWSVKLAEGYNNPTPLVHDGVMFLYTFPDTVMALDASSGELLWRYQQEPEGRAPDRKMGIALGGNMVFVPTSDMRMLALNMKTGAKLWQSEIAYGKNKAIDFSGAASYKLRAAPIVADDKVIMGVVSSIVPTGGFIFALDMETGKELWRFRTVAQPGTPGGNSWNGQSAEQRTGGSVWNAGSYDADLGLVYFGVAPTYRVQPFYRPVEDPSQNRDAKYTNGTVALDVKTGGLRWHYSHHIMDHWDLDWAHERQIIDLTLQGEKRRVVATVSKGALLDALDAATGDYLFSVDMGIQTTISAIDSRTGMKTNNPDTKPGRDGSYLVCPTAFGARSWTPTAFDSRRKLLFQPFIEACFSAGGEGYPMLMTGVNAQSVAWPGSKGKIGRLHAIDMEKGETRWLHRQISPIVSSTLATAGGLVFAGDLDPSLKAFDSDTGKILWQSALTDDPSSSIITYAINGKQYLALVIGQSNNHHRDWKRFYTDISKKEGWHRPAPIKGSGASVQVFSLDH